MPSDKAEKEFSDKFFKAAHALKDEILEIIKKEIHTPRKTKLQFVVYILMLIVYTGSMIEHFGWVGLIISIVTFFVIFYMYKDSGNANPHMSNTPENIQIQKKSMFTKGKIIKYTIIFLIITFFFDFPAYFVEPEISITSPQSGDIVKFDKDNPFYKISGNSKGLANNPFLHLNILDRRVDSNRESSRWYIDNFDYGDSSCSVYSDGSWECRIQPIYLYRDCINNTIFIIPPNNKSNNISTNIDIVAIISKQTIWQSILSKLRSGSFRDDYYIFDYDYSFYDYGIYLPKHISNAHVTINPVIAQPFNTSISCGLLSIEIGDPWNIDQGVPFSMRVSSDLPSNWQAVRQYSIPSYGNGVEGANITLDNSIIGTTNEYGNFYYTFNISGKHNLSATKEKYISVVKEISIISKFEALDINIIPNEVYANQEIVIKSNITNVGTEAATRTVELIINNTVVDNRLVTLAQGEVKEINFSRRAKRLISPENDNPSGNYIIEILEQKKLLEIKEEPLNYLLIGGLAIGLMVIIILYYIFHIKKRK